MKRRTALREQLESIPLANFTVGELPSLLRILGALGGGDPYEHDFNMLERKLEELEKKAAELVAKG